MKLIFLLAAVIGVTYAAPMDSQLFNDFKDFFFALPLRKIRGIIDDHLENDPEFKAALKYLQSKEFKRKIDIINKKPSVKEARSIIIDAGVDIEFFERLGQAYVDSLQIKVSPHQRRSFGKVLSEIDDVMPYDKLFDILDDKLENSTTFKKFFDIISSDRMHYLSDKILYSEEVKVMIKDFTAMDVPTYEFFDTVYEILGWKDTEEDSSNDLE